MRRAASRSFIMGVGLATGLIASGCPKNDAAEAKTKARQEQPGVSADPSAERPRAVESSKHPEDADEKDACKTLSPIYATKGVHNPCYCGPDECVETRKAEDPPDPRYPEQWVSRWNMFRVFNGYQENLPPYADPPAGLEPGVDYELSHGATYYDNGYRPADGDGEGAMMEHYEKYCLPIFPIDSHFTCSFISLGNKAYFLTYEEDRPKDMPPCCLFSPLNHPPRPDFIKHLPYSPEDSTHVDDSLQAYRYVAKGPDDEDIWFAYAFYRDQWLDEKHRYLKPQSFYFSGSTHEPPNAPFVSQNYVDFKMEKPDPTKTWDLVAKMCPEDPPPCHLFEPLPAKAEEKAVGAVEGETPNRGVSWNDANFSSAGEGQETP